MLRDFLSNYPLLLFCSVDMMYHRKQHICCSCNLATI